MLYNFGRALFRIFFDIFCAVEVEGEENVPAEGGLVLAPNHISYLDPPLTGSVLDRPVYFMAKRELFSIPVLGFLIRRTHAFPVSRGEVDRTAIRNAQQLLEDGKALVIFPEGTRSPDGKLQDAELGFAMIATRAKVPVVPVAISGADRVMPRGSFLIRPAKIKVTFGKAIMCDSDDNCRINRKALQPFADNIMKSINSMLPENMQHDTGKSE